MSFIWHKFESMQQMRHVGVVAYVMKNVFNRAQKTDSDMIVIVELSSTAIKQLQPGCVHSARFFHIKGSDLQYVSQMCNITPLEVEISIRRRKFHRKLFDLVGDIAVGVVFHSLSASVYLLRFYFFSFFSVFGCAAVFMKN